MKSLFLISFLIHLSIYSFENSEAETSFIARDLNLHQTQVLELDEEERFSISSKIIELNQIDEVAMTEHEIKEGRKTRKDIKRAIKEYIRYKRKNRKTVRKFKREAKKLSSEKDLTDSDIEKFKAELKRNKIKLGMHLVCAPRAYFEGMFLLIGGGPIHCTDKVGQDNPDMNYEGHSFILGVGVGVFAHIQHLFCLLDTSKIGESSVNLGLTARISAGLGVNASTLIGMNGVCVSAGVGLGVGGLVRLGGLSIKKLND